MLTMRNWMFIKQYAGLREYLLGNFDLRGLGDFAVGAFDEVPNDVLSVTVSVLAPIASPVRAQHGPPAHATRRQFLRPRADRAKACRHSLP